MDPASAWDGLPVRKDQCIGPGSREKIRTGLKIQIEVEVEVEVDEILDIDRKLHGCGVFYLGPMSFEEFLPAHGRTELLEFLRSHELGTEIPVALHRTLIGWLRGYLVVGGMPASVAADIGGRPPQKGDRIRRSVLGTFQEDFAKYQGRLDVRGVGFEVHRLGTYESVVRHFGRPSPGRLLIFAVANVLVSCLPPRLGRFFGATTALMLRRPS